MVISPTFGSSGTRKELVDLLISQKSDLIRDLITEFNETNGESLSHTGDKDELREKIQSYLDSGKIDETILIDWTYRLESWKPQHIYLYTIEGNLELEWRDEASAKSQLKKNFQNIDEVFGNRNLLVPVQNATTLASIIWSQERLRICWVDENTTTKRDEVYDDPSLDQTIVDSDGIQKIITYKAYEVQRLRRLIAFEWHFPSATAMIQVASSRLRDHDSLRKQIEDNLLNFMIGDIRYTRVSLGNSIRALNNSELVIAHHAQGRTPNASIISIRGRGKESNIREDRDARPALRSLQNTSGRFGDYFWHPDETYRYSEVIHTQIYSIADQQDRIYTQAQYKESDIRSVLSRIREFNTIQS